MRLRVMYVVPVLTMGPSVWLGGSRGPGPKNNQHVVSLSDLKQDAARPARRRRACRRRKPSNAVSRNAQTA